MLFWGSGVYDSVGHPHWADWRDGHWRDEALGRITDSSTFITSFTCSTIGTIGRDTYACDYPTCE